MLALLIGHFKDVIGHKDGATLGTVFFKLVKFLKGFGSRTSQVLNIQCFVRDGRSDESIAWLDRY